MSRTSFQTYTNTALNATGIASAVAYSGGGYALAAAGAGDNLGGVRFYLAAANTYRFTFATTSGATVAAAIANTGELASSVSAGGLTISQSNGFMLQNVTEQHQYVGAGVTVYIYTVCWVSTQPPGWNTNIYPP